MSATIDVTMLDVPVDAPLLALPSQQAAAYDAAWLLGAIILGDLAAGSYIERRGL